LNGTVWGVSRINTGGSNFGQGQYNLWASTQLAQCGGSTPVVLPPNDVIVCNGQLREAMNDGGGVTVLAMYAKQPFDFANRTGTIAFDVSNDTQGIHTVWPELWVTDKPVPAPFIHFIPGMQPQHGFGVRFAAASGGGNTSPGGVLGPHCTNDTQPRWTVDSAIAVRNYVIDDSNGGSLRVTPDDCVVASPGPNGPLNHVEVRVSQNQIDVYATDAGTSGPLHHLATIANANLSFTRGLVWIEDAHYNADKFGCHCQAQHTFTWDNVGFDGPVLARDLAWDANDAMKPMGNGQVNLGWLSMGQSSAPQVQIPNVAGMGSATAALLTFNFYYQDAPQPQSLTYTLNGHTHTASMPYPDTTGNQTRTLSSVVPLSEVLSGTNTVSIWATQPLVIANIDLIMVGAAPAGSPGNSTPVPTPTTTTPPATTPVCSSQPTPSGAFVGTTAPPVDCPMPGTGRAYKFTATGSGNASTLHIFLAQGSNAPLVQIGVYSNSSGNQPATLLTAGQLAQPAAGTWNSVTVPTIALQSGVTYWLAVLQPTGSAGRVAIQGSSQVSAVATSSATNLGVLPASWTSSGTTSQPVGMLFAN
jgi:hypothetical protein